MFLIALFRLAWFDSFVLFCFVFFVCLAGKLVAYFLFVWLGLVWVWVGCFVFLFGVFRVGLVCLFCLGLAACFVWLGFVVFCFVSLLCLASPFTCNEKHSLHMASLCLFFTSRSGSLDSIYNLYSHKPATTTNKQQHTTTNTQSGSKKILSRGTSWFTGVPKAESTLARPV